ncbi:hypothetical protein RB10341 [Rhodopirellula baltica SH 1]|uniref:Uncharacterized protein n=1 Tax=Rhodopirellula baltica (strain DSM 10527 / NCIMB 13988 / SH1) TaxID=243090 RepID=Q7UF50_RHOBA|nr:hypothetical protein RB10341 [Rhodopirellula baltica SH 1]
MAVFSMFDDRDWFGGSSQRTLWRFSVRGNSIGFGTSVSLGGGTRMSSSSSECSYAECEVET